MTSWMDIAEAELGQAEVPGAGNNPRIQEYHASASDGQAQPDSVPWCASFCGWVLQQVDIQGTGSRMARSYLDWGVRLEVPRPGCIVVLKRGNDPNSGHVGFFHSRANGRVMLLGGNQGDKVSIQGFPESQVLGYRWPPEVSSPPATTEEHFEQHDELSTSSLAYRFKGWLAKAFSRGGFLGALAIPAFLRDPVVIVLLVLLAALAAVIGIEALRFNQRKKRVAPANPAPQSPMQPEPA